MPPKIKKKIRFIVATDDYLNEVLSLKKESTYLHFKGYAKRLVVEFGHMWIEDITKKDLQKFIVRQSASVGLQTINQLLIVFKGIMQNADDDWEMFRRLTLPKAKRPKREYHTFRGSPEAFEKFGRYGKGFDNATCRNWV